MQAREELRSGPEPGRGQDGMRWRHGRVPSSRAVAVTPTSAVGMCRLARKNQRECS